MTFDRNTSLLLVVGCGSIGRRHLGTLASLGATRLAGVDVREDRLEEARTEVPGLIGYRSLDEALAEEAPGAALICTPTAMHVEAVELFVERSVPMLIEKPLSNRLEGIADLEKRIRDAGIIAMVAYSMRFHPAIKTLKGLVEDGSLGEVIWARAECGQYLPDWHPWEDYRHWYMSQDSLGGGATLDLSHEFDYLRWMLGDVESVVARVANTGQLEIDTDDTCDAILEFGRGRSAQVHLDLLQRAYRRTVSLVGSLGTAHWTWGEGEIKTFDAENGWSSTPVDDSSKDYFVDEMRHFMDCLEGRAQPLVSFEEGRRSLEVALAAKRSSRTGARVTPSSDL